MDRSFNKLFEEGIRAMYEIDALEAMIEELSQMAYEDHEIAPENFRKALKRYAMQDTDDELREIEYQQEIIKKGLNLS